MKTKYKIQSTNKFKKMYHKLITKRGYKEEDFLTVLNMLANDEVLPERYNNHLLEPKKLRCLGMPY